MTEPRLIFLRVGQGDSIVLVGSNSGALLIDLPRPQDATAKLRDLEQPTVAAVYVTHAHRDHAAPLIQIHRFVVDWLKRGRVHRIYLPDGMWGAAVARCKRLRDEDEEDPEARRLWAALDSLDRLSKSGAIQITSIRAESGAFDFGAFRIVPLHPRHIVVETQKVLNKDSDNALSLVLRIERDDFRALLLADAEGVALTELDGLPARELRADVVKIPHHGAWPQQPQELESVLTKADPLAAVISVGSCNSYGHVREGLFSFLLKLRQTGRLQEIRCTEVTRTCVHDAPTRLAMKSAGLKQRRPCAGEVQIAFPATGGFEVVTETNHPAMIAAVERPACLGKADL